MWLLDNRLFVLAQHLYIGPLFLGIQGPKIMLIKISWAFTDNKVDHHLFSYIYLKCKILVGYTAYGNWPAYGPFDWWIPTYS